MRALSNTLWHERDVLDLLAHRLETERLLVESGRTRRLALSVRETDAVLAEVQTVELGRVTEAQAAARVLGLAPETPLREIAQLAPAPWGEVLIEHREALQALVEEITVLTETDPNGAGAGATFLHSVRDSLEASSLDDPTAEDSELTDAVIELQLQELSRQAAEARGQVLHQGLMDFLS